LILNAHDLGMDDGPPPSMARAESSGLGASVEAGQ